MGALPYNYINLKSIIRYYIFGMLRNLFNEGLEICNWEIDKNYLILAEYQRGDIIVDSHRAWR